MGLLKDKIGGFMKNIRKKNYKTVGSVLLHDVEPDDIVIFMDGKKQIGCTMATEDRVFIKSLDSQLLFSYVKRQCYRKTKWTTKKVKYVYLAPVTPETVETNSFTEEQQ